MSDFKKDLFEVKPMEGYEAPKVPTLQDVHKNPTSLKKLPKRWAKNAAVLGCVGVLGATTFAGCIETEQPHHGGAGFSNYFAYPTEQEVDREPYVSQGEFELAIRLHHGGSGWAGYVVYLTEQEALGIIRTRLEAAGLRFGDDVPNYTAFSDDGWMPRVGINLFDAGNNVAVSHLTWSDNNTPFIHRITDQVIESFENQTDVNVGVFYTSGFFPGWDAMGNWAEDEDGRMIHIPHDPISDEEMAQARGEARPILEEHLNEQIEAFITFLRSQGIVE